jgi:Flp pilus assembly protein TadG
MHRLSVRDVGRMARDHVARRLSLDGRSGETGAIAILLVILLGTGVLLGAAALAIDTGSLLYEQSQLQNGADAAALAIATTCLNADKAGKLCAAPDISSSSAPVALAGKNAADGTSAIDSVCGSAALVAANPGAFPTPCATVASPTLVQCPNTTSAAKYVEVRTSTLTSSGSTVLPPILAQTLAGGSYSGETVRACARVGWGPAGGSPLVLPVTFSICSWQNATGANPPNTPGHYELPPANVLNPGPLNPGYGTAPNTPWPLTPLTEITLYNQGKDAPASCTTWNNHVAPGTFGELPAIGCQATVVNGWVQGVNGSSWPCDLSTLSGYRGQIVYIPIFDCYSPTEFSETSCNDNGPASWYHISGYASFYLTGFYFSAGSKDGPSIWPPDKGKTPCKTTGDRCISGWFTTGTLTTTIDTSGAPGFGSYVSQVLG